MISRITLDAGNSVVKASTKLIIIATSSLIAGLAAGFTMGWEIAPLVVWDMTVALFVASTWYRLRKFDANLVKQHALREDPSRVLTDIILIVVSIASLGAVGLILAAAKQSGGAASFALATLGVLSVIASWTMLHTVFTLKYAENYYTRPQGGVDFGKDADPIYSDFAYLAFTIGMTYQVSDTSLQTRRFRVIALRHALLSFLMGTVIIATTINLVAGLGK